MFGGPTHDIKPWSGDLDIGRSPRYLFFLSSFFSFLFLPQVKCTTSQQAHKVPPNHIVPKANSSSLRLLASQPKQWNHRNLLHITVSPCRWPNLISCCNKNGQRDGPGASRTSRSRSSRSAFSFAFRSSSYSAKVIVISDSNQKWRPFTGKILVFDLIRCQI